MKFTSLDDLSMAESLSFLQSGNHFRHSESGFHSAGVPGDHQFRPELSAYHRLMSATPNVNPNYQDSHSLHNFQLESDFGRLSLSDPFMPEPLSYTSLAATVGGSIDSSLRKNLPVSYSFSRPRFSGEDIQRTRPQFAASGQIGLDLLQRQTYPSLDGPSNSSAFSTTGNLNGFSTFGSCYNSAGRCLNAAAVGYRPRAHRSDFRYGFNQLNLNRCNPNFRMESGNPVFSMSDRHMSQSRHRPTFSSLEELRGKVFIAAKDQSGCRFLQNKFEEGNPEDIDMIYSEVKDHICELMVDQFGNYMVQKLFDVCCVDQITELLEKVVNDWKFKDICLNMHGTRAVQKLLERLSTREQKAVAASVLRLITVELTKSMNGHHVIQHCLKFLSEDIKQILVVVADNCLDIATDKSGCCVLQQCLAHAYGEPRERLITKISANALVLSEHPYGNYVVQYVLGLRESQVTADILAQLSGHIVSLSTNKFGSNVVEKCLKESVGGQADEIIEEIVYSPNFLRVLQDPYGNYVAQSALLISKGAVRDDFIDMIDLNYPFLHSHPHGKRVLARARGNKLRV